MFVSDVSDFSFVGKVEPYFLSAGEEVNFCIKFIVLNLLY